MIECYEGRLGGGKTYSAVCRMVEYWCAGGVVATNVSVCWSEIKAYALREKGLVLDDRQLIVLEDGQISLFHRHVPIGTAERPTLVVVDEAHIWFNARDWDKASREFLTMLTQSRKIFLDVIFISQSIENVDKQIRRLIQYIWRFRDMSKWRIPVLRIRWPFNQILSLQFDYDGRTLLQRSFSAKNPAIFKLYNTYQLLRTFEVGTGINVSVVRGGEINVKPLHVGMLLGSCVCAGIMFHQTSVSDLKDAAAAKDIELASALSELQAIRDLPPMPPGAASGNASGDDEAKAKASTRPVVGVMEFIGERVSGAWIDGQRVMIGEYTKYGRLIAVWRNAIKVLLDDGTVTVLQSEGDPVERGVSRGAASPAMPAVPASS